MNYLIRRRELERQVAEAIHMTERLAAQARQAEQRAQRAELDRQGLLDLHQPIAIHAGDLRVPLLVCAGCTGSWPCRTLQYAYHFGEFAPPE